MKKITVNEWTEMFRDIGLSDDDMKKWHRIFEERYPDSHQSFLAWLALEKSKIEEIRKASK